MKKQTKLIGVIAVAVVSVLVLGYVLTAAFLPKGEHLVYVEEQVKRGTLTVAVTESGSLEYGITPVLYDLNVNDWEEEEASRKYLQIEEICVATGQRVRQGDALIRFTWDSVEAVKALLENSIVEAKASCVAAEHDYELAAMELKAAYDNAKVSQEYASDIYEDADQAVNNAITALDKEITLRKDMTSFFKEEVEAAQADYDETKKEYQEAKKKLSSAGTRNVPNYLALNEEYQEAQTKYFNAQNELKEAEQNQENNEKRIKELEDLLADAKARIVLDKLDVEAAYSESTLLGDNAQMVYDAAIADLKKVLEKEEALLKEQEERLEKLTAFVGEDGVLYAGKDGVITGVTCEEGDKLTEKCSLLDFAGDMNITVNVAQEDVVSLKAGDRVEIEFSVYPEAVYSGTILTIGTTAIAEEDSAVRYQVMVGVDGDTGTLYSGMAADVTFTTRKRENVLYVSQDAIVKEEGRSYVYVQTVSGGYALKEVETGIYSDVGVEILFGLKEGDIIYVARKAGEKSGVSGNDGIDKNVSDGDAYEGSISDGDAYDGKVSDGDASDRRKDRE